MPTVKKAVRNLRQPHGILVRDDWTLIVLDNQGKDWIEVRPVKAIGIGPALDMYRVNGPEPVFLVRFPIFSIRELIKFLPSAINAAHRAKSEAETQ